MVTRLLLSLIVFAAGLAAAGPQAAEPADSERLAATPYYGYELILQIDKAPQGSSLNAQRLRAYRYHPDRRSLEFLARWHISTGAEAARENRLGRVTPRSTLTGYYPVETLKPTAYSNSWDGLMLYSMFYDVAGGYAIHATDPNKYARLGRRASGGCTRLEQKQARFLYKLVAALDKGWTLKLDRTTGAPVRDANARPVAQWGYKALVLIEDGSRLEATRLGFISADEVYKDAASLAYYSGTNAATP